MKRAVVLILVAIAMVLLVFSTNRWLSGSISFAPRQDDPKKIEEYSHYLEALLTSVDQLVSMLVTIQLSLFVLAGFALNKRLGEKVKASATLIGFGGCFMLAALISLTLGYSARIQALALMQFGTWQFDSVQTTVVWQSTFVVISGVAAVCMTLVALLDKNAEIRNAQVRV